jgi:thymidylate synthase ThyX
MSFYSSVVVSLTLMINIDKYLTNSESDIYGLINLPEEVVAVLFAYYSRSSGSLKDNLLKLLKDDELGVIDTKRLQEKLPLAAEKAHKFHEKWVISYGHASVAEHAIAHIAVEKISILLSKIIEDSRLASFTEKSSRFVSFKNTDFYSIPELDDSDLRDEYIKTGKYLLEIYCKLFEKIYQKNSSLIFNDQKNPSIEEKSECNKKTCDIVRYLLPTATFTNLGMTVNSRELSHIISKMLSNPLKESNDCACKLKEEGVKIIPTLIEFSEKKDYIVKTCSNIDNLAKTIRIDENSENVSKPVRLINYEKKAEYILATSILYEKVATDFGSILTELEANGEEVVRKIIDQYLKDRGPYDQPLRGLEHIYYTFDILIDYGAFRDIQRHRIATQTSQIFKTGYGYSTPDEIFEFGFLDMFDSAMDKAKKIHEKMYKYDPNIAQYILPLAFRKRVLFTWNLRELHHFISLRTAPQGHKSYRSIAYDIFKEIERVHPFLAKYIRVNPI